MRRRSSRDRCWRRCCWCRCRSECQRDRAGPFALSPLPAPTTVGSIVTVDPLHLAKTVEARLAGNDLTHTIVDRPSMTIEPARPPSSNALAALDALRALGATLGGRIDVHQTIGEGGMGVVHLATQATLGRHVAVKTLRAGKGDKEAALRILREAWVTGTLEHPNVVPVHDVGVDASGEPVIVMKRIEGHVWSH